MRFTIPFKLMAVIAVAVIILIAAFGVQLADLRGRLWEDRENLVRSQTDTAIALTNGFAERAANGELSIEDAQAAASAAIRSIRYGEGEYLFVLDQNGTMLMHPIKPELDGTDQTAAEDANGKRLFAEMVKVSKSRGSGMVEYMWSKPGSEVPVPKMSYVATDANWNWIIGTGVYIDDLNAAFLSEMLKSAGWLAGALLLLVGIAVPITRSLTGPIARITGNMKQLAEGDLETEIEGADRNDEIGDMARAVEVFKQNGERVAELGKQTQRHLEQAADYEGQITAIGKSQAVIEFDLDGHVQTANEHFLDALGYHLDEIKGRHHSMFVTPDFAKSAEYRDFWDALKRGEYQSAEYLRIGKGGKQVWIQASYNPILDLNGEPYKVVKYATDITGRKHAMHKLSASLELLAQGRLNARIEQPFIGEFESVRAALNQTIDRLVDIVVQLKQTSHGVKTATGEILSGANDLSERTTKQAATIEQTSAAMEQLAQTVIENAKRAEGASESSRAVSHTAEEGGEVMRDANMAMEKITQSSAKISNIIGMIDDIAFQTNLLALNASVEAARAGEAGKGFAVVAVEVRRLAQSAAEASSEVKSLIEQSGVEVAGGTKLVASAAEKLESMLSAIKENNALMEGIARESREQASAIEEVNVAVRQMDEMTQHNAALVEETNAAIEQTENQASKLDGIVEIFTLEDGDQMAKPASRPVAPAPAQAAKTASAAKTYLSRGNAAIDQDWSEF